MDEGSIVLDYISPPGTSLEETEKLQEVEKLLSKFPKCGLFTANRNQMGFFITEPNSGDYLIQLKKNREANN